MDCGQKYYNNNCVNSGVILVSATRRRQKRKDSPGHFMNGRQDEEQVKKTSISGQRKTFGFFRTSVPYRVLLWAGPLEGVGERT